MPPAPPLSGRGGEGPSFVIKLNIFYSNGLSPLPLRGGAGGGGVHKGEGLSPGEGPGVRCLSGNMLILYAKAS